jgi:HJR/Mrr/RecB family endonuclease
MYLHKAISVVLQCKKSSTPVGNKAVQEAHAGKGFMDADYAIVVSNNSFTPSAKQLASTLGILLLHHDQLHDLYRLIHTKKN